MRHGPAVLLGLSVSFGAACAASANKAAGPGGDDAAADAPTSSIPDAHADAPDATIVPPTDAGADAPHDATLGGDDGVIDGGSLADTPISDALIDDAPIDFGGGWTIPDAGSNPPLVGDGGTTTVIGSGADPSSSGKFGGAVDPSASPSIVYPPNGVMIPPNTNTLEFHFIPGAGQTLFKLSFQAPTTTLELFFGCTAVGGGCVYTVDPSFWTDLVPYARGAAPVTYTLSGVDGASPGAVGVSAQSTILFDQQNMTGGVYYWNTAGVIERYDYGAPASPPVQYLTPADIGGLFCVGCHAISREGYRIVAGSFIPSPADYSVVYVPTKAPVKATSGSLTGTALTGQANFFSFSPDENQLLTSDGNSISWRSLITGEVASTPVAASGTMPDWSPDGTHMVYAQPASPSLFAVPGVSSASIATMHFNGTGWDTPETIVPFAGQNNYYPAYSPDGAWVAFNRSPSNAESFSNAAPDPDAGTVPDGELWAVASAGGTPVRLSMASNPGACSWPKWAPVLHDYYAGQVMWLTVSSDRAYGLRLAAGAQTQLWMMAFDPAKMAAGADPSFPAFWLPFQDITSGNHIAQWTTAVRN